MNWENINLNDSYERDQNMIDPLSFDTLLLEISCNISEVTKENITAQFEEDLKQRIESAREIFNNNINNIFNQALKERSK